MKSLDEILKATKPGAHVYLSDPVYYTRGNSTSGKDGVVVPEGVSLSGWNPLVYCIPPENIRTSEWVMLYGEGTGINLERLTFIGPEDTKGQTKKLNGISLVGTDHQITECHTRNTFGNYNTRQECFAIKIFGSVNGRITRCSVRQCLGDYTSALGLEDGWITSNSWDLPGALDLYNRFHVGINVGRGTPNTYISGNHGFGGTAGFYVDSHTGAGITLDDNTFVGCRTGYEIKMQQDPTGELQGVSGFVIREGSVILDPAWGDVALTLMDNMNPGNPQTVIDGFYIRDFRFENIDVDFLPRSFGPNTFRILNAATNVLAPTPTSGIQDIRFANIKLGETLPTQGLYRNKNAFAKGILIDAPSTPAFITI